MDDIDEEPHIISQEEDSIYEFENIIGHRPPPRHQPNADPLVQVKWKDYDDPTWEPLKEFTDNYTNQSATQEAAKYAQDHHLLDTPYFEPLQHHVAALVTNSMEEPLPKQATRPDELTPTERTFFHQCLAAVHPDTGKSVEYTALLKSSDGHLWEESTCEEIGRLAQGYLPTIPKGTDTLHFIRFDQVPKDRKVTYLKVAVADRPLKSNPRRVRFTAGGDQIDYPGDVSTKTSDMITAKILFNSVISTSGARFLSVDLKDFYLNTPMRSPEYMRIPVRIIPKKIMEQYNLAPLIHNGYLYVEITKSMYGLPQAGRIANDALIPVLEKAGYHQSDLIPGLFKHDTRPIAFALVVDDFGIKYTGEDHAQHLIQTLKNADYKTTEDWEGKNFCGLNLKWDYDNHTVDVSMDGYIEKALQKFMHPKPPKPQHSPHKWIQPDYGAKKQMSEDPDTTPPLDKLGIKRLQQVVGTLLFYARAVDPTMLVALGTLAAQQTKGTEATMTACCQLLDYAATHPDAAIRYRKSGMILMIHSDASYLSEPKARSRAAGYFFLGDHTDITNDGLQNENQKPNGAIHVPSIILGNVMSSATEAEVGALFHNAQEACPIRTTLEFLGHPQPPTPIRTDNACADGIINETVKAKRSKAMDMRFYWVRDRVKQKQFYVYWKPGKTNYGDYFTKHHPTPHHRVMRPIYIHEGNHSINHCEGVLISLEDPKANDYAFLLFPQLEWP